MKKIITSLFFLLAICTFTAIGTSAYFIDRESTRNNSFNSGKVDLKIDNLSYYNGELSRETSWRRKDLGEGDFFFNFTDLKPTDDGHDAISLHVSSNASWACMEMSLTSDDDVSSNEPELESGDAPENSGDDFDGELGTQLSFVFWSDDGDNVIETGENIVLEGPAKNILNTKLSLADSVTSNVLGVNEGQPLQPNTTYYISKAWCFGTLIVTPLASNTGNPLTNPGYTCDGDLLDNSTQTDALTADVSFTATQKRNNNSYKCPTCEGGSSGVSQIIANAQQKRKNGSNVLPSRSNTSSVFGNPDGSNPVVEGKFFSLGYGGSLTYKFSDPILNGAGSDDLTIHEATNGRSSYPLEKAKIEVSQNGSTWTDLGEVTSKPTSASTKDLGSLPWALYVRITDTSNSSLNSDPLSDGFDLDAIVGKKTNTCLQD